MFDVGFSRVQRLDLFRVDVDPCYHRSTARKLQRQRQTDVAKADDGDLFHTQKPGALSLLRMCLPLDLNNARYVSDGQKRTEV